MKFDYATIIVYGITMIMIAITVIDFKTSEIPDSLVISILPFAVAAVWLMPDITLLSRLIGFASIALPMFLLTLLVPGAFGGGDIKLIAACGFLLGWQLTLVAFFIAVLLGGTTAVYLMVSGRRRTGQHMVFGPAICTGVVVTLFYGNDLILWYLNRFLYP
jgi:leader peptidase (prepilin peptidase)/N-methyltransferase